jgi:5-(carboxyamino)imidazole ribonucleotide synthase
MTPLKIGATIGILGGGQLGRMLGLAGAQLGFDIHIFEPEPDCPAGRVAARCVTAPWDDRAALADFAAQVDVITFEFENVPLESLAFLAALKPLRPGTQSLTLTKDRLIEKQFINSLGIATAPFVAVDGPDDLRPALAALGPNGILKTRQLGYDGKGQMRVTPNADIGGLATLLADQVWIYEGLVDFEREVSVILARSLTGEIVHFDVTENVHQRGILNTSRVPAAISSDLSERAKTHAATLAVQMEHVGVMAVEFFLTRDGSLLVNEIAPRVHNSGHWTQDGCHICQFQQHMRAVAGWPLGDATRHAPAIVMTNLIGEDVNLSSDTLAQEGVFVHLYGKREARAGRKMGHINTVIDTPHK